MLTYQVQCNGRFFCLSSIVSYNHYFLITISLPSYFSSMYLRTWRCRLYSFIWKKKELEFNWMVIQISPTYTISSWKEFGSLYIMHITIVKCKAFWDKTEDVLLCLRNMAICYNYTKKGTLSCKPCIHVVTKKKQI